jgi:hypothetical protein
VSKSGKERNGGVPEVILVCKVISRIVFQSLQRISAANVVRVER